MESNFQKCSFLETGVAGIYNREGVSLKGDAYWREPRMENER